MAASHLLNQPPKRQRPVALAKIPAFPPVAIRVLHLLTDDEVAVDKLAHLLEADPAFSAELLRRANSPLFGFESRIASVQHALLVLGLRRTKSLALTVATGMYMKPVMRVEEFRKFWRYSLACAFLCEEIARASDLPVEMAYTAGLLHDVGRLGLMVAYPEEYSGLLREMNQRLEAGEPFELPVEEARRFGMNHYEAGRLLAKEWNLPEELHAVVGRYPAEDGAPVDSFTSAVRLACRLAYALGFGVLRVPSPGLDQILATLPEHLKNLLPADPRLLQEVIEEKIRSLDIQGVGLPATETPEVAQQAEEQSVAEAAGTPSQGGSKPIEPAPVAVPPPAARPGSVKDAVRIRPADVIVFLVASAGFMGLFLLLLFRLFPE